MYIREYFQLNENINTTYQNLWNATEEVSKGKLLYQKRKSSHIKDLNFHIKKLRKEEQ